MRNKHQNDNEEDNTFHVSHLSHSTADPSPISTSIYSPSPVTWQIGTVVVSLTPSQERKDDLDVELVAAAHKAKAAAIESQVEQFVIVHGLAGEPSHAALTPRAGHFLRLWPFRRH